MGKVLRDFFASFWWGLRELWWLLWWSRSVRVASFVLWLISLLFLLVQKSPGTLFLFELASATTAVLWAVPFLWGAYRLYTRVTHPAPAGWSQANADLSQQLRSDWMQQIRELGFTLAGYLTKGSPDGPCVALFIDSKSYDSAHVSRVAGKELLVFKTRFADGFAFETARNSSAPLLPAIPNHPVFRFSQIGTSVDLYKIHQRLKHQLGSGREPVISDAEGEIDEFVSRAEVVRRYMMSRDYRRSADGYRFTVLGAIRQAVLLTWPSKPIREAMFSRKMQKELTRLGLQLDKEKGRILG
jgi:hypothetical protein